MAQIDWSSVRLAVFDVDGTLYDQKRLRLTMAALLGWHCARGLSLRTARILRNYRHWREDLADAEASDFEAILEERLAGAHGGDRDRLRELVTHWMEVRPLPYLAAARRRGVAELFDRLRSQDKLIGILSDYPAREKLAALGLAADFVVSARDSGVNVMKPNPAGLHHIMALAGTSPAETVLIGDRCERDGEAGRRAGVRTLVLGAGDGEGWSGFAGFPELWPA